ncbi:MAG: hypothetical protein OEZ36_04440 [Spirochaetota bacterium]|nr:hypothetical protein [Spirochaetota bacterium]
MKKTIIKHSLIGVSIIVALHFIFYSIRVSLGDSEMESRISQLINSPAEARSYTDKLKKDISTKEKLIEKLNEAQRIKSSKVERGEMSFDSLRALLKKELAEKNRGSFWGNFIVHFLFFLLGGVIFAVSSRLFKSR